MLQQRKLKDAKGFTIIEVLIVLAIAGLIMLIVFLAVPALQRNQRNQSRKNDASRVGTAASNFVTNNNGTKPSSTGDLDKILADAGSLAQWNGMTSSASAAAGRINVVDGSGGAVSSVTVDGLTLVTGAKCSGTGTVAGNGRQMALLYAQETQSSTSGYCLDI